MSRFWGFCGPSRFSRFVGRLKPQLMETKRTWTSNAAAAAEGNRILRPLINISSPPSKVASDDEACARFLTDLTVFAIVGFEFKQLRLIKMELTTLQKMIRKVKIPQPKIYFS